MSNESVRANQENNRDSDHDDCEVQNISKPLELESHVSSVIPLNDNSIITSKVIKDRGRFLDLDSSKLKQWPAGSPTRWSPW